MNKIRLGDKVRFPVGYWDYNYAGSTYDKVWVYMQYTFARPLEGIICGVRTKWMKTTNNSAADWAFEGVQRSSPIRTYLIATDLRGFCQVPCDLCEQIQRDAISNEREGGGVNDVFTSGQGVGRTRVS